MEETMFHAATAGIRNQFLRLFQVDAHTKKTAELLGYTFAPARLVLPRTEHDISWTLSLQTLLSRVLTKTFFNSETARRELLIAPIFLRIAELYNVQLNLEYEIQAGSQLRGSLDYFIQSGEEFIVVEGKNEDMNRGASQLVAEMAALDKITESDSPLLYGALSISTVWQFCALHRKEKRFEQDVQLYLVPDQIPDLCAILIGILKAELDPAVGG